MNRAVTLIIRIAFASLAAGCTGGDDTAGAFSQAGGQGQVYALLIGIGIYPDAEDALPGPPVDVDEMEALLLNRFDVHSQNILVLRDEEATRTRILDALSTHLAKADTNGSALLYFAGHGAVLRQNYSVQDAEETGVDQALYVWADNGKATVILDDEIAVALARLPARTVAFIAEACFSAAVAHLPAAGPSDRGGVPVRRVAYQSELDPFDNDSGATFRISSTRPIAHKAEIPTDFISDGAKLEAGGEFAELAPYVLLSASATHEVSFSASDWPAAGERHGVFTYYLTRALQRATDDTPVGFVIDEVTSTIHDGLCLTRRVCQTPTISGPQRDRTLQAIFRPSQVVQ